ncbi:hypothetical protein [Sulfuricurvum sp. RIFCSPLOWO2_12_FULL_43_24]|uniref:hypothetical protein n=1 Tax=Sulfuricurvum sp. RIFCSPLOWO2_12_FULL_43_24 TaxID=1802247 RepID=UPI0008D62A1A|nr:hypothetical protein [Sulfuricurvum sp. RIFCSPLOWO2_12_FULL_43_24]OHD90957.1 MAG: hypothetical protein A3G19_02505 [Sulfuricurvum sp. RIFCSPLOWO2_12_FULL_43_24]
MPIPQLSITLRNANYIIDKLETYRQQSQTLEVKYQYFIAEMIMLRLFAALEDSIAQIAFKLAAGASYTNGLSPTLTTRASNVTAARALFLQHGRPKPIINLKWTQAKHISDSVKYVIPTTEKFIENVRIHGRILNEMRIIRNVLAHNSTSAKIDFKAMIRQIYGAQVPVTTGAFLTSTRRISTSNLEKYLLSTKIILNDMTKGT